MLFNVFISVFSSGFHFCKQTNKRSNYLGNIFFAFAVAFPFHFLLKQVIILILCPIEICYKINIGNLIQKQINNLGKISNN